MAQQRSPPRTATLEKRSNGNLEGKSTKMSVAIDNDYSECKTDMETSLCEKRRGLEYGSYGECMQLLLYQFLVNLLIHIYLRCFNIDTHSSQF